MSSSVHQLAMARLFDIGFRLCMHKLYLPLRSAWAKVVP